MTVSSSSSLQIMALVSACALGGSAAMIPKMTESNDLRFVVLGDMPYSDRETQALRTNLTAAIAQAKVPFVIHYGDFKAGNDSCTDDRFQQAYVEMEQLHPQVFYTPGDNDWTDCDRPGLLEPKSELERLNRLRTLFFSKTADEPVARQDSYPENARWWQDNVVFSTVHIVGTNNGRSQVLKDDPSEAIARVEARDQANLTWLHTTFAEAKARHAQAIVLAIQADISEIKHEQPCSESLKTDCDAYFNFRTQLIEAAAQFRDDHQTQKPVLLIHGDTFPFCWDQAFGGERAPNLWRLNAWGDFQQPADVTAIAFRPDQPQAPFMAETLINQVAPGTCSAP